MSIKLLAVTFAANDPGSVAGFWAALLDRDVVATRRGRLLPGSEEQLGLSFTPGRRPDRWEANRMHLHLTSTTDEDQRRTVARAVSLGARHLDVGQRPEEEHVVLADPEGNEFCVIEADNSFLAGCGRLGELACDGGRDVGLFWSAALGWPLVWDQDEETAIQSPSGGTKIAWGGSPTTVCSSSPGQGFELVAGEADLAVEVERLVGLGATRLDAEDGVVVLADPDRTPLRLLAAEG